MRFPILFGSQSLFRSAACPALKNAVIWKCSIHERGELVSGNLHHFGNTVGANPQKLSGNRTLSCEHSGK